MNIAVKNLQRRIHIKENHIKSSIQRLCTRLNLAEKSVITIVFVNDKTMQELNYRYLNHNFPTDVLAFNFSRHKIKQKTALTGDIIINTEMALRNAPIYKNNLNKEITLYIIHGILHLLGFNDAKSTDKKRMQRYEEKLLGELFSK